MKEFIVKIPDQATLDALGSLAKSRGYKWFSDDTQRLKGNLQYRAFCRGGLIAACGDITPGWKPRFVIPSKAFSLLMEQKQQDPLPVVDYHWTVTSLNGETLMTLNLKEMKRRDGYWYIATPYSRYHRGREAAYQAACRAAAELIKYGLKVFSPIAHTHPIATYGGMDPVDHDLWLEADRPFIEGATGLVVVQMDDWAGSIGVSHEIQQFIKSGRPVYYMPAAGEATTTTGSLPPIVGLCGYAGSGKDVAAKYLCEEHHYERIGFADQLKEAALALNPYVGSGKRLSQWVSEVGWDAAKRTNPTIRELLQRLGTEVGRNFFGQDCWVDMLHKKLERSDGLNFVIPDVRFENEAKYVRDGGGILIAIQRAGVDPVNDHISEKYPAADVYIRNNGTLTQLFDLIDSVMEEQ